MKHPRDVHRLAVSPSGVVTAALCGLSLLVTGRAEAARSQLWEVTFAVRLTSGQSAPVAVRLALPSSSDRQRLSDVEVAERGLRATITPDGDEANVRFRGKLKGSRRLAVSYRVRRWLERVAVPPVHPVQTPPEDLLPFLSATPLLQSRSILVRDFLETHVTPMLHNTQTDLMRVIFAATRKLIDHDRKGKTLVLDVVRARRAQRIGIERAFTTFLRCARIPARFVEGIDVRRKTRRKRVFWTEVWAAGRWWPVSASAGWVGRLPATHVALARDGVRVLESEGDVEASYRVHARRLKRKPPTPRKDNGSS